MSESIIAIDPGKSGGIAFGDGSEVELWPMPETEGDVLGLLRELRLRCLDGALVYIEEVGGFVKGNPAPGSSMFNFGRNFGFLLGACSGLGMSVRLMRPQKWQQMVGIPARGGKTPSEHKNVIKAEAQRRYPRLKITLKTCDALMLLEAAKRSEQ